MREILFRGKRTDDGEWVEGYYQEYPEGYVHIQNTSNDWFPVIPETVGQFTGLLDKNGKKIFEGDILDTPRWIVSYCADTNAGLGMNAGWYIQRDNFTSWLELENSEWHVVLGNIHDNPELLKSST